MAFSFSMGEFTPQAARETPVAGADRTRAERSFIGSVPADGISAAN